MTSFQGFVRKGSRLPDPYRRKAIAGPPVEVAPVRRGPDRRVRTGARCLKILRAMAAGEIWGCGEIRQMLELRADRARNGLVHLHFRGWVERESYGRYRITDAGRKQLEAMAKQEGAE